MSEGLEVANIAEVSYGHYTDFCEQEKLKPVPKSDFYEYVIFYFIDAIIACDTLEAIQSGVVRVGSEVNVYISIHDNKYFISFDCKSIEELNEIYDENHDEEDSSVTDMFS
jgi:hypothetical protein